MQTILNCEICDKELYTYEIQSINPFDYAITCSKHKEFRGTFQVWKIRQLLGYEYINPAAMCAICLKKISNDELELTMPDDMWIVCEEHAPYRNNFDLDKVRAELEIYIDLGRKPKISSIIDNQIKPTENEI